MTEAAPRVATRHAWRRALQRRKLLSGGFLAVAVGFLG
jgi:hypothetical protein